LPECWQGQFGRPRNIGVWMVVPHCLMLCPWQERNGLSFQNFERSLVGLKFLLFRTLFDWVPIRGSVFFFFFLINKYFIDKERKTSTMRIYRAANER
jgi:hypothetical protein